MKIGQLEIDLNELTKFIVEAKKSCYAGNGKETKLKDGSKLLTFQKGNFHYIDNYDGFYQTPGTELVRWQNEDGQRLWQMSYSGGMESEYIKDKELAKETFEFLKEVLSKVTAERPFRGPRVYENNKMGFIYRDQVNGNIERFSGREDIYSHKLNDIVFSQDYIGELVISK
jgi:hypothetical protein